MAEHAPADKYHFELHGGEPFLLPAQDLKRITAGIRTHGPISSSISATTNLVYTLTDELRWFIKNDLQALGTSWDNGIRFANEKQEALWRKNLKTILSDGMDMTLNVSVTRSVIGMDQQELLMFLRDTGVQRVQFERITSNGSAVNNSPLFPSNTEINEWYLKLHEASEKLNARDWFYNAALENVYAKTEKNINRAGTFCRNCEDSIFTVNANGSIAGCPNSAPSEAYGHIAEEIETLFQKPKRLDVVVSECLGNDACLACPVYTYCGGDCHRLAWEGAVCAAPKLLMMKLAGLEYQSEQKSKRFIPIKRIS